MNNKIAVAVLGACIQHIVKNGESPTVRELCMATGTSGTKEVWWALHKLESIGVLRWNCDESGRKVPRGIELLIPLKKPVLIPIVGYISGPADFVPGERHIEMHEDGRIVVRKGDEQFTARAVGVIM